MIDTLTYSDLFDLDDDDKGIFIGGELYQSMDQGQWRVGVWTSTADHDYLDGSGRTANNYGAYVTFDRFFSATKWNLRLGVARDEVSEAASFIGVALETPVAGHTLGAGLARTGVSGDLGAGTDDTTQAELYVRMDIADSLQVTPSIQWIRNSGFDSTGNDFDERMTIAGVRITYTF